MKDKYVLGIDFGSDSVRATVVNPENGCTLGSSAAFYPRWKQDFFQHPEAGIFRQHPSDYLEALQLCVNDALSGVGEDVRKSVIGIGIDTTGSTPVPVNRDGVPLALTEKYAECEDAMFHLWKDHSAMKEAQEIEETFTNGSEIDYGKYQGKYSAEWFWAKILHTIRKNPEIRKDAYTWEEHADWIVGLLCGETRPEYIYHSACAAGHKALWHSSWNGLPSAEVLNQLDPYLARVRERYGRNPEPAPVKAGLLSKEWAQKLGLPEKIVVSGSSFDSHAGAVGAGISEHVMVCTIGTSSVDMIVERADKLKDIDIRRLGGQAENSILPDYIGVETGQAAFGDIFAWFKKILMWGIERTETFLDKDTYKSLYEKTGDKMLEELESAAQKLPEEPFPIALDWFNGRRYPDTDDFQKAMIADLTFGVDAPVIYRSLIFAAVCGMKRIVEGFEEKGVLIRRLVAVGGISKKSSYIMQMMADTLGKNIEILEEDQTCALGASIYAAVASGFYKDIEAASSKMSAKPIRKFTPDTEKSQFYQGKYKEYLRLTKFGDEWNKDPI